MAKAGVDTYNSTNQTSKSAATVVQDKESIQKTINKYNTWITQLQTAIAEAENLVPQMASIPFYQGGAPIPIAQAKTILTQTYSSLMQAQNQLAIAKSREAKANPTGGTGGSGTGTAVSIKYSKDVIFNASSAKENYFESNQTFFSKTADGTGEKQDMFIYSSNTPSAVSGAKDLWKKSNGSKGMIQTWKPPGNLKFDADWATPKGTKKVQKYGFQFLYNPERVNMSYGGVADVDPSMMSSGKEEYLLSNPTVFKSTVNFTVLVNRMYDLKHMKTGGDIKGDLKASDIWAGNIPDATERKRIYEYGTMYDIEFLLKSMLRFELKSQLRKDMSADFGYLGASPVELHLGNKLRYVVQISGIDVEHILFDDRMVPMFSKVTINTTRMPDYSSGVIKDISK